MRIPTRVIGDSTLVSSRIVSTQPCKLLMISGVNSNAATRYIQVHQSATVPAEAAVPIFSFPVATGQYYSFDFEVYGADLDAVTVCNSSTLAAKTIGTADCTIQAIIRG